MTKAYDKAWLNAILYTMNKSGITPKNWRMIQKLNTGLTAKIRTKHGLTDDIHIKDSIRQGGVLSVIEYSNLIDEIAKEIKDENKGQLTVGSNTVDGCLLWMDDVALIHTDNKQVQDMLDITQEIANRYHIKFGKEKSQILSIGKEPTNFSLGADNLDKTDKYKYLGIMINNKGNMEEHIKTIKGKTEAALQTILNIAGYNDFNRIYMEIIWKLFNTSIISILTYSAEAWIPTKSEIKKIQKILDNTVKRILNIPITTPTENIILETGIWNIESIIARKQLNYYYKIIKETDRSTNLYKICTDPDSPWNKNIQQKLQKYDMQTADLETMTKYQANKHIKAKIEQKLLAEINQQAENKSKVKHMIENTPERTKLTMAPYMRELSRRECRNIFLVRSRMAKVKTNYKGAHSNLLCRWCKKVEETQTHIFQECENLKEAQNCNYENIFQNEVSTLRNTTQALENIMKYLEET